MRICNLLVFILGISACQENKKYRGATAVGDSDAIAAETPAKTGTSPPLEPNEDEEAVPLPEEVLKNPPFKILPKPENTRIGDDFIPFFEETQDVLSDLSRLNREDRTSIPFVRYLTLTHLDYLEAASPDDFVNLKVQIINSISVLLNSMSREISIEPPTAINDTMGVFRIDLRDYGWSSEQWDRITLGTNNGRVYPYGSNFDDNLLRVQNQINSQVPIVRADWFLTETTKASTYYDLLAIPESLTVLESELGVARINDIQRSLDNPAVSPRALRLALSAGTSKKSANNRLLERHRSNDGYFWISYDFGPTGGDGTKNIFNSPVGPSPDIADQGNVAAFRPDGFEAIFSLRNGLQGFAVFDANGVTIAQADPNVVNNPNDRNNQGLIQAGVSCLRCHGTGLQDAIDSMRSFMLTADEDVFSDNIIDATLALHPDQGQSSAGISKDRNTYRTNVQAEALLIGDTITGIAQAVNYYEKPMTKDMAASELNITLAQFERKLPGIDPGVRLRIQALDSGSLDRELFEEIFPALILEFFDLVQAPAP